MTPKACVPIPPYTTQLLTAICRSCCILKKFRMLLLSLNRSYPQPPSLLWYYSCTACGSSAMSGIDIHISGFESMFHQQTNLSGDWKCEEASFITYDHVSLDLTFARNFYPLSPSCFASSNYYPYFKVATRMEKRNCFIFSMPHPQAPSIVPTSLPYNSHATFTLSCLYPILFGLEIEKRLHIPQTLSNLSKETNKSCRSPLAISQLSLP